MYQLDDASQHLGVGGRQDSVAEVEDMSWRLRALSDDRSDNLLQRRPGCEQQRRVQVALNGVTVSDARAGIRQ